MNRSTVFPRLVYPLACLLLLALPVHAQSPVWKVEKDGRHMFIGGSMHILKAEDYPLPQAFDRAYRQSAQIVFETDIARMNDPAFQQYLLREVSYSDGRSLQDVVNADTYGALVKFFAARGVPMTSVDHFKPGMVATLATVIELQRLGIDGQGVDAYFDQRVASDQKARGQLETVEQQVAFIANMGAGEEDAMLRYNLAEIEQLPALWREMTRAWRSGDLTWLDEQIAVPMRRDYPTAYETLLVSRNNAWMPQIEAMAKTPPVEFVLVGALHLSGKDGLLAQLVARGSPITQLR